MTEHGKVTCEFHNALVQSITAVSDEEEVGIYDLIKILIFEMNQVIDIGEVDFGPSPVFTGFNFFVIRSIVIHLCFRVTRKK